MPITIDVEYTDTFAGEPNYSWVRRATLKVPEGLADATIMRRAKKAMGLSGLKGRTRSFGDCWDFVPHNVATVLLVAVRDAP